MSGNVTMEKTNMFLFSEEQARPLLVSLGTKVVRDGKSKTNRVMKNEQVQERCKACNVLITLDNLGHIAKGSKDFYCDKPACFTHFVANKKIR